MLFSNLPSDSRDRSRKNRELVRRCLSSGLLVVTVLGQLCAVSAQPDRYDRYDPRFPNSGQNSRPDKDRPGLPDYEKRPNSNTPTWDGGRPDSRFDRPRLPQDERRARFPRDYRYPDRYRSRDGSLDDRDRDGYNSDSAGRNPESGRQDSRGSSPYSNANPSSSSNSNNSANHNSGSNYDPYDRDYRYDTDYPERRDGRYYDPRGDWKDGSRRDLDDRDYYDVRDTRRWKEGEYRYPEDPRYPEHRRIPHEPILDKDRDNFVYPNRPREDVETKTPDRDWVDRRHNQLLDRAKQTRETRRGDELPRFGERYFHNAKFQLIESNEAKVPQDYSLTEGDQLDITTYNVKGGESSQPMTIDNKGEVFLPGAGPVNIRGMNLSSAQAKMSSAVTRKFPNMRVKASVIQIRKLRVFLVGEVRKPGGYLVNPGSTSLDALLAGGGPTKTGSYRRVQLQRDGQKIADIDLYSLLMTGKAASPRLRDGDRIFVPAMGPEVVVDGEVIRPARYELLHEKSLQQVLNFAGGLKPEAYAGVIHIERVSSGVYRTLADVRLKEAPGTKIQGGDSIYVSPVLEDLSLSVFIEGAVRRPGWYALTPGMTVSALIKMAQGLEDDAFPGHAELYRQPGPAQATELIGLELEKALKGDRKFDLPLKGKDRIIVHDRKMASFNKERVRIDGEITRPGEYPRFEAMTVRDLLVQAGGLTPEAGASAEIARPSGDGRLAFLPVDVEKVLDTADTTSNYKLQNGDLLVIRRELRARRWPASVTLGGEVRNPGVYAVDPTTDTLASVIARAGGLTEKAYPAGAVFVRNRAEIMRPDHETLTGDVFKTLQQVANQFAQAESARLSGANRSGGQIDLSNLTNQKTIQARDIDHILSNERIPLNLNRLLKDGVGDPGLREGDVVYIPAPPTTVVVAGAVIMPTSFAFDQTWGVQEYIDRAGGYAKDAETGEVLVMRAGGEVRRADRIEKIMPGDTILVPPRAIVAEPGLFERFVSVLQVVGNAFVLGRILR